VNIKTQNTSLKLENLLSKHSQIIQRETGFSLHICDESKKEELYKLFLEVIKEGNSYPQIVPFSYTEFQEYFFPKKSIVLICKAKGKEIAGGFFLKPNFPGRCSHIANAGYLVKKKFRGKNLGFYLGKCSIDTAKELSYRGIMFNLVFEENTPSIKLWGKLGFKTIGVVPNAVKKDDGNFQNALIMFLDLN